MTRLVVVVVVVLSLLAIISSAVVTAGPSSKTQVTFGLNTELLHDEGLLYALEPPTIQWETSDYSLPNGAEIEGGFKLKVQQDDGGGMPCWFWGSVKKSAAFGSKLSCLVETSSSDFHKLAVDLSATKDSASLQVTGSVTVEEKKVEPHWSLRSFLSASVMSCARRRYVSQKKPQRLQANFEVQTIKLLQSIVDPLFGGRLTVMPCYNIPKNKADITASYGLANTVVILDANLETQKLSVSQVIKGVLLPGSMIKPSIDTNGNVEIQYSLPFPSGWLTGNYKHADSLALTYVQGSLVASVFAPPLRNVQIQYSRPFASGSLTANYKHADSLPLTYEQDSLVASVVAPPLPELLSLSCKPQDLKFTIRKAVYLTDKNVLR